MDEMATSEMGKPVSRDDVDSRLHNETLNGADFLDQLAATVRR